MSPREKGFLLLTSHLGNPDRPVLTQAQLRILAQRVRQMPEPETDRDLTRADLLRLGYGAEKADRILALLDEDGLLEAYCRRGARMGCQPVSRVHPRYPEILRHRLGWESPGCLWAKGNPDLLEMPKAALVGSRDLQPENAAFAAQVGRQAARQGYVLVSGNARGADRTAQDACLQAGGAVISVVADGLEDKTPGENLLYLSEDIFDGGFSAHRALSRNRVIHALGAVTFVAQSRFRQGGTWDGTVKNLRSGWSPVFGYSDGSAAMEELAQLGLNPILEDALTEFSCLEQAELRLFEI